MLYLLDKNDANNLRMAKKEHDVLVYNADKRLHKKT